MSVSRRQFMKTAAAISAASAMPGWVSAAAPAAGSLRKVVVRTDTEIGTIRPEFHGQFAEHLGSCVYGGLWVGLNSPIPNINGYRKAAVDYLKELGVPVLRWPGGCFADDYHWRDGIGPVKDRPKRVNIHWGGYVEDNSFGTHEFVGLCRLIGAEPYFAGNVGSGTPEELRDWVEYCNMPSGSSLAEERAKNGSPQPFNIKLWGVGNENWGCGGNMRPEVYADLYRRFSTYVRPFGGTRPFMIASGPNGNDVRWSRGFFDTMQGGAPDGFAMHYYSGGKDEATKFNAADMNEQFASFPRIEDAIKQQRALLDSYSSPRGGGQRRRIGLLVDEWGVWDRIPREDEKKFGALYQQSTMRSAVAAALGLNVFNRQADKLWGCNIAQMVNVLQSMLLTDGPEGKNCVRTTSYHAFALFKPHRGNTSVAVETDDNAPVGLSVSASKKGSDVIVTLVNATSDTDMNIDCELRASGAKSATAQLLHDADLNAFNGFDNPDRVVPRSTPAAVDGGRLKLDLPRLSVATVTVKTA